tara:strand:- start:518 stop:1339 length:822 start_codon:yes stop_codon:yes gene_type:complete
MGIFSKVSGALFGKAPKAPKQNEAAFFRPFGFQSGLFDTNIDINKDQTGFSVGTTVDPRLIALQQQSLGAVSPLMQQQIDLLSQAPEEFRFQFDPTQATQSYFQAGQAMLDPVFAQQRQQLQGDLFGSGRLGLKIAGEGVGAGAGGMVNPDAFGLGRAQSQALTDLYGQSREAAMAEGQQMFQQALGSYQAREQARQDFLRQLGTGQAGMLSQALGLDEEQRKAASEALGMEALRAGAVSGTPYGGGSAGTQGLLQSGLSAYLGGGGTFGFGG